MNPLLNRDELDAALKPFRLRLSAPPSSERSCLVAAVSLLQPEGVGRAAATASNAWGAELDAAAVSLLTKGYARALCGALYAYYHHQIVLRLSLEHLTVDVGDDKQVTIYYSGPLQTLSDDEAAAFVGKQQVLAGMFEENLSRLLPFWAGRYHISLQTLWENTAVYLHHFFAEWKLEEELNGLLGPTVDWFGVPCLNPLAIQGRYIPHPLKEDSAIRVRTTCCLKYKCADSRHCYTCPSISEEERLRLIHERK